MEKLFFFLSFFTYVIAWVGFCFYFKTLKKEALKLAQWVLALGLAFHSCFWIVRIYQIYHRWILCFKDILNFLSWELVVIYFFFHLSRIKAYTIGFFLLPLILILLAGSYFFPVSKISPFTPLFKTVWFPLHAISSLFSHGFLLFGVVVSIMYILQEREIKKKKLGLFFRKLPPLESLDRIAEKCVYLGFIFLTFGMITGAIWSELAFGDYWRWSPKEVLTLILWLIYGILIHQRVLIGWRGKKSAYMFILGFIIWFLSFFVINLMTRGFHTYA